MVSSIVFNQYVSQQLIFVLVVGLSVIMDSVHDISDVPATIEVPDMRNCDHDHGDLFPFPSRKVSPITKSENTWLENEDPYLWGSDLNV